MMNKFLSCDWGTSSFRLRLIDAENLLVIAEEKNDAGISGTFKTWQQTMLPREEFYADVINRQIASLAQKMNAPLEGIPVVLSGMASSTIGMVELPYKSLPFRLDGADLVVQTFQQFVVISGACTAKDVMRGEETKITGCSTWLPDAVQELLLILPGTHPKHVIITGGQVRSFQTFMTGEFFDLLSTSSILAASVKSGGDISERDIQMSFSEGVKAGQTANLLHASFMVRTNQVLQKMHPQHNYFYLSGLLIGAELKDIKPGIPVYLAGGPLHTPLYSLACKVLNIPVAGEIDADKALIRGQQLILSGFANNV